MANVSTSPGTVTIPLTELHRRPGRYVRSIIKQAVREILITERGAIVARLVGPEEVAGNGSSA